MVTANETRTPEDLRAQAKELAATDFAKAIELWNEADKLEGQAKKAQREADKAASAAKVEARGKAAEEVKAYIGQRINDGVVTEQVAAGFESAKVRIDDEGNVHFSAKYGETPAEAKLNELMTRIVNSRAMTALIEAGGPRGFSIEVGENGQMLVQVATPKSGGSGTGGARPRLRFAYPDGTIVEGYKGVLEHEGMLTSDMSNSQIWAAGRKRVRELQLPQVQTTE